MNLQQKQQYLHVANELPSISELPAIVGSDVTNDNTSDDQDGTFTDDPNFVTDSSINTNTKPVRVKSKINATEL